MMMIQPEIKPVKQKQVLRSYQEAAITESEAHRANDIHRVMISCPTGAGKTTIAAEYISRMLTAGQNIIFIAHRTELIEQAAERLEEFGIKAGIIKSGYRYRPRPVQVASIQTLDKRTYPDAHCIIIDEAHHAMSSMYKRAVDHYINKGAFIVGLSATPYRLDGKGLGDLFDEMVAPVSIVDLIAQGYLVKPRYITPDPSALDLDGVGTKQKDGFKDYDSDSLYSKHFGKAEVFAGLIDNYRKYAAGKRTIIFNCNLAHSQQVVDAFNAAGYPAVHVDGKMDRFRRKKILKDFAAGRYLILCNVQLLTEGYDLPSIECVIVNRKTKSKALWVQMVGRALRPSPGKEIAWVIDQGANVYEHGRVDANEVLTLELTAKKPAGPKGVSPVKECPSCQTVQFMSAAVCSDCGYIWPKEDKLNKTEIEFVEVNDEMLDQKRKKKTGEMPAHLRYKPFAEMTIFELDQVRDAMGHREGWVCWQLYWRVVDHPRCWDLLKVLIGQYADLKSYKPDWVEHAWYQIAKQKTVQDLFPA